MRGRIPALEVLYCTAKYPHNGILENQNSLFFSTLQDIGFSLATILRLSFMVKLFDTIPSNVVIC